MFENRVNLKGRTIVSLSLLLSIGHLQSHVDLDASHLIN